MASHWQSTHQKLGFHADGRTKAPQSFLLHFTGWVLLDSFHWSSQRIRSTSGNTPTFILLGTFPCVALNLSQRAEAELLLKLAALLCGWGQFLIYPWWSLLLYVYSVNNECSHPSSSVLFILIRVVGGGINGSASTGWCCTDILKYSKITSV